MRLVTVGAVHTHTHTHTIVLKDGIAKSFSKFFVVPKNMRNLNYIEI